MLQVRRATGFSTLVVVVCAGLWLGLSTPGPAAAQASSAHPPTADTLILTNTGQDIGEDILLELRLGRLTERLAPALDADGRIYLPVETFLRMAEIDVREANQTRVVARLQPGDRSLLVSADPSRPGAWLEGTRLEPHMHSVVEGSGQIMMDTRLLEAALGIRIQVEMSDLSATVMDPSSLPLARRLDREHRWKISTPGPGSRPPTESILAPSPYRTGGMVAEWSTAMSLDDPRSTTSGSLGVAGQLMGGQLQVSARSLGPVANGQIETSVSHRMVWPGRRTLRQMHLGDVLGAGPRPQGVRGIHLTNAPYVRDNVVGTRELGGRLGPGWDVELRQRGQVVETARVDERGAWALDIPVHYGNNAVEVVAYGPHGEVVTTEHLTVLQGDRLPRGTFEWGLSAGECTGPGCSLSGALDLRYGASEHWTLRTGAEGVVRDTLPDAIQPYAELSGSLHRALQLQASFVHDGFVRASTHFTPSPRFRLRTAATRFDPSVEAPVLHDPRRRSTLEADLHWQPLASRDWWTLRGSAVREERVDGSRSRWEALSGLRLGGFRTEAGLREMGGGPGLGRGSSSLRGVARLRGPLSFVPMPGPRSPWAGAELEVSDALEPLRARLRMTLPVGRSHQVEVAGDWSESLGSRLTLSMQSDWSALRSVTQHVSDGETSRSVGYAQGSIRWNEATGGLTLDSGPGLERSGLSGYVYLDETGTGRMDPGDEPLAGIRVMVAGRSVMTDEHGRYEIWDLVPWERSRVELDARTLDDPRWVSSTGPIEVPLTPASYRRLDLPVVRGGELSGRVVRPDSRGVDIGVAGVELLLSNLNRPGLHRRVTTFSDGQYYIMGLRPGAWEVRIMPGLLGPLQLVPDHFRRTAVVEIGGAPNPDIDFRLLPDWTVASPRERSPTLPASPDPRFPDLSEPPR